MDSSCRMQYRPHNNERYCLNVLAENHHQHIELDASKTSLGFIMNQSGQPDGASREDFDIIQPASIAPQTRTTQLQSLPVSVDSQTHIYEQRNTFHSTEAPPPAPLTASVQSMAPAGSAPTLYGQLPDFESRRVLISPPLDSTRRAPSTRSIPNSPSTHQIQPEPAKAIKKKPAKKQKVKASDLSYEEKRKSRVCNVDGCENYLINRGIFFRHGVSCQTFVSNKNKPNSFTIY